jgi:hypothetical protein
MTYFWNGIAWQWPYVVGTLSRGITAGLLILATAAITRWWIHRSLETIMPQKSQETINELRVSLKHYIKLHEEERDRANKYAAVIKASIATASHTLMNLQGNIKPPPE